jgi:hypothetical protein
MAYGVTFRLELENGTSADPPTFRSAPGVSWKAGVSLFTLSRRMGTSVEMIDRTYGHLAPDAEEYERGLLDEFDNSSAAKTAGSRPL